MERLETNRLVIQYRRRGIHRNWKQNKGDKGIFIIIETHKERHHIRIHIRIHINI